MSRLIKEGLWIGNYGVGVHGFLFKLPVALIYLLTGPSIFVATAFHVILACVSAYIFYKILKDNLKLKKWSLIGLLLFITNFQFMSYSITFHRETPILFALLLFTKLYLDKKSLLVQSLAILLILDAKEYVFPVVMLTLTIVACLNIGRQKTERLEKVGKSKRSF